MTGFYVGRQEPVGPAAILVSSLLGQYGSDSAGSSGAIQTSSGS